MTNLPQNDQIQKAIESYCKINGMSRSQLATQINVSGATLSKIDNGKWDDIDSKLWRKIWNKVSDVHSVGILTTAGYTSTVKTCDNARNNRFMVGLLADTGIGKTTALLSYSMQKNVFYVCYDKTMKPKQFFIALLKSMGINFEGSINEMVNRIADEINTLERPLIIVDEAGKLIHTMILYLHVLRDKTIKNCGIVLGGMPYFKENLIKFSNKEKEGYAEFFRRVNLWQVLEGLSRKEIAYICNENGIDDADTIKSMYPHKRFGDLQNAILLHQIENTNHESN